MNPTHPKSEHILDTLWQMTKDGYEDTTIAGTGKRLRMIAKFVNLNNPEAVKEYIASKNMACISNPTVSDHHLSRT